MMKQTDVLLENSEYTIGTVTLNKNISCKIVNMDRQQEIPQIWAQKHVRDNPFFANLSMS